MRRGCPSHPVTASPRNRHVPVRPPHSASRNPRHPVRPGPSPGHRKHPQKRRHSLLLHEIGLCQALGGSASRRSSAWLRVRRPALSASARGMRRSNLPQDVRPHKTNRRDMPFGKDPTPRPAPPCRHRSPRPFCFLGDAADSASAERTATHRPVPARQRRAARQAPAGHRPFRTGVRKSVPERRAKANAAPALCGPRAYPRAPSVRETASHPSAAGRPPGIWAYHPVYTAVPSFADPPVP